MAATEAAAAHPPEGLLLSRMQPEDAAAALVLSDEAGWNQTVEDWRFMLGQGPAVGLKEPGGAWVGSSLVLPRGPAVSWVSMVLISRRYRGKGLGTMLLDRCIDAVRESGAVPGLDATELGRPLYLSKGFRDLYPLSRWRLDTASIAAPPPQRCTIHRLTDADIGRVMAFDRPRTHTERGATLRYLLGRVPDHAWFAEIRGELVGYALGRPGRKAAQIGPVVAETAQIALDLIGAMTALADCAILDVPDVHGAVTDWLQRHGAVRARGFMRMTQGEVPGLDDPKSIFALAGPELS